MIHKILKYKFCLTFEIPLVIKYLFVWDSLNESSLHEISSIHSVTVLCGLWLLLFVNFYKINRQVSFLVVIFESIVPIVVYLVLICGWTWVCRVLSSYFSVCPLVILDRCISVRKTVCAS